MFNKKLLAVFLISILTLQVFASPYRSWEDESSDEDTEEERWSWKSSSKSGNSKLHIGSVYDKEFKEYGRIVEGYSVKEILKTLKNDTPLPDAVEYVAEDPNLMATSETEELGTSLYGGLPYQFGYCNGHNTKLNCLEYHRDSEYNLGTEDFILLLAKLSDVNNGKINSSKVKAFKVPKGVLVEVYATTLHYAPCHVDPSKGFKVLVALPKGTNVGKPDTAEKNFDDRKLFATNKWLLAHKDATSEVESGAYIGITGKNIDIANLIKKN
ncbi:hypothetical protein PIROE2DRAFT_67827 [Piromyces sp. E2]|nr:hypothetical protein PIROE2DRAFT_67827 [Piromyces sp. E2]|eukprot:OUM57464.1 hypothetical protein PIROE2DRAFT_67827 [Piromyces sp. E2]